MNCGKRLNRMLHMLHQPKFHLRGRGRLHRHMDDQITVKLPHDLSSTCCILEKRILPPHRVEISSCVYRNQASLPDRVRRVYTHYLDQKSLFPQLLYYTGRRRNKFFVHVIHLCDQLLARKQQHFISF